jgi:uncharacterized protein YkwD
MLRALVSVLGVATLAVAAAQDQSYGNNNQGNYGGQRGGQQGGRQGGSYDGGQQGGNSFDIQMLCAVNAERRKAGLKALGLDPNLTKAAVSHSQYQARTRKMSHTGQGGSSPSTRIKQSGFKARSSGENVAYGYKGVKEVMKTWMNSPGHRANILGKDYTMFGSGVANAGSTPYYTQDFGSDGSPARNVPKCDGSDYAPSGGGGDDMSGGSYGGDDAGGDDYASGGNGGSKSGRSHGGGSGKGSSNGGRSGGSRGGDDYGSSQNGGYSSKGGRSGGSRGGDDYGSSQNGGYSSKGGRGSSKGSRYGGGRRSNNSGSRGGDHGASRSGRSGGSRNNRGSNNGGY